MTDTSYLIFGPPSELRDAFELAMRRHTSDVNVCERVVTAQAWLRRTKVRAVLVVGGGENSNLEPFLSHVRAKYARIPAFFVGTDEHEALKLSLNRLGAVVLPTDMPAVQVARTLFPATTGTQHGAPGASTDKKSVTLGNMEYPLQFGRAKAQFETEYLTRVLAYEHGNISEAARVIGVARRNLQIKIQMYNIRVEHMREET